MTFRFFLFGSILAGFLFVLNACQSQQNAYKKVYEPAKSRSTMQEEKKIIESSPVIKKKSTTNQTKADSISGIGIERIFPIDGNEKINSYSVVVGSFVNSVNAESLKERMEKKGYPTVLTKNEKGMYRVITGTFDCKDGAIEKCEEMKRKFASELNDIWILKQAY